MFINHGILTYHVLIQFAEHTANNVEEFSFHELSLDRRFILWAEISDYFSLCLANIDYHGSFRRPCEKREERRDSEGEIKRKIC